MKFGGEQAVGVVCGVCRATSRRWAKGVQVYAYTASPRDVARAARQALYLRQTCRVNNFGLPHETAYRVTIAKLYML